MSGKTHDLNNMEKRAIINFFLQTKAAKEIHAILKEISGEYASSYATVKTWLAQFKRGDIYTCYGPCLGRHKTGTTPESIYQIHELILGDRQIWQNQELSYWAFHVSWLGPSLMKIW